MLVMRLTNRVLNERSGDTLTLAAWLSIILRIEQLRLEAPSRSRR